MTSPSIPATDLLRQLRDKALAAVGRQGFAHLVRQIENGRAQDDAIRAQSRHLNTLDIGEPPERLINALRSPAGVQRLIHLYVLGRSVRVVVNPLGYRSPPRERAVWAQVVQLATGSANAA